MVRRNEFWVNGEARTDLAERPLMDAERNQTGQVESLMRWSKVLHGAGAVAAVMAACGILSGEKYFKELGAIPVLVCETAAWALKSAAKRREEGAKATGRDAAG
jgi:hypothetical protein